MFIDHDKFFTYSIVSNSQITPAIIESALRPIIQDRKKVNELVSDGEIDMLAAKIAEAIETKMKLIDTRDIDDSLGDIKRLSNYKSISIVIDLLKGSSLGQADSVLDAIVMLHNLIKTNKVAFVKAYKEGIILGKWLYRSLIVDLIQAVAQYIAQAVVVVSQSANDIMYKINPKQVDSNTPVFKRVNKHVNVLERGQYDKIQKSADLRKNIRDNESSDEFFTLHDFDPMTMVVWAAGAIALLLLIRESIAMVYKLRRSLVKEMNVISNFLKVNSSTNKSLSEKVAGRQAKLADAFDTAIRIIRVEHHAAAKEAASDINSENAKYRQYGGRGKDIERMEVSGGSEFSLMV